jgi:GNAT superfamily N-acetyltransferase
MIEQATCEDIPILEQLVARFWGDPVQLMFDRRFKVTEQPALVGKSHGEITGFLFYRPFGEMGVLIVALGVIPRYQGGGVGQELLRRIEEWARSEGKRELLVVTSNDNLPALAFYQRNGFQLYEVAPDVIAQKLGGLHWGIGSIPIRDELRLRKVLTTA